MTIAEGSFGSSKESNFLSNDSSFGDFMYILVLVLYLYSTVLAMGKNPVKKIEQGPPRQPLLEWDCTYPSIYSGGGSHDLPKKDREEIILKLIGGEHRLDKVLLVL